MATIIELDETEPLAPAKYAHKSYVLEMPTSSPQRGAADGAADGSELRQRRRATGAPSIDDLYTTRYTLSSGTSVRHATTSCCCLDLVLVQLNACLRCGVDNGDVERARATSNATSTASSSSWASADTSQGQKWVQSFVPKTPTKPSDYDLVESKVGAWSCFGMSRRLRARTRACVVSHCCYCCLTEHAWTPSILIE